MAAPILLVHGAFSRPAHLASWSEYFTAAGYQCHAPALPAHDPVDAEALRSLTLEHYLAALVAVHGTLPALPIVIGHSMGGLLAQKLVATAPCAALVCVASAPPAPLTPQLRALPYLVPMFPKIMAGLPIEPSKVALRYLALNGLPQDEQRALAATLRIESGRAYRQMVLGLFRVPNAEVRCPVLCVSGGEDRIISRRIARFVAARYDAEDIVFDMRGHWLIAPSATEEIAGSVLRWLRKNEIGKS